MSTAGPRTGRPYNFDADNPPNPTRPDPGLTERKRWTRPFELRDVFWQFFLLGVAILVTLGFVLAELRQINATPARVVVTPGHLAAMLRRPHREARDPARPMCDGTPERVQQ
jgi:hypothetical protein